MPTPHTETIAHCLLPLNPGGGFLHGNRRAAVADGGLSAGCEISSLGAKQPERRRQRESVSAPFTRKAPRRPVLCHEPPQTSAVKHPQRASGRSSAGQKPGRGGAGAARLCVPRGPAGVHGPPGPACWVSLSVPLLATSAGAGTATPFSSSLACLVPPVGAQGPRGLALRSVRPGSASLEQRGGLGAGEVLTRWLASLRARVPPSPGGSCMASDDLVSGVPKHHIRYGHLAHGVAQGSLRPARAEGGGVRAHRPTGAIATGSRALFPERWVSPGLRCPCSQGAA